VSLSRGCAVEGLTFVLSCQKLKEEAGIILLLKSDAAKKTMQIYCIYRNQMDFFFSKKTCRSYHFFIQGFPIRIRDEVLNIIFNLFFTSHPYSLCISFLILFHEKDTQV